MSDTNDANWINSVAKRWNVQIYAVGAVGGKGGISGIDPTLCDI